MSTFLSRFTLLLITLLACLVPAFAQQVFPVNVSGQLMPPNSLRIGDYFTGSRTNDVMFNVVLQDPVEASRQVKLQLQVESNGGVVLRSDLAMAPIITLNRNFPEMLTGATLAPYFRTLRNARGQGVPLFLTPGLNGLCIEVVDVATEKIISNRGCARGFFNLAQPPRPQSPLCGQKIEQNQTQNITFNWLPMHNASGNPVNDIRYVFQLVRIPDAIQNPKDAFDAGLFTHTEEVRNMTSLLYTEGKPLLEKGKQYAWRVRAQALAMDGSIVPLFDNNGYSQICTFTYTEPTPPADPANFSSCTGSPCNFSGTIASEPKGANYLTDQEVKLGYYKLKLDQVNYDSGGETYSGTGKVFVDFLGTSVAVEFTNLKINKNDRVFGGEVKAKVDNPNVIPPKFNGDLTAMTANLATDYDFDDNAAKGLVDYFNNTPNKLTSKLGQTGAAGTTALPIGMDVNLSSLKQTHVIAITDMVFTPTTSKLNAVYAIGTESGGLLKFGSKGVCFRNKGLVDASPKLFLLNELPLKSALGVPVVLEPTKNGIEGTTLNWNCGGFQSFSLRGRVEISRDVALPTKAGEKQLIARFSGKADQFKNFTATVDIPEFTVPGLGDFAFKIGEGFFDYSSKESIANAKWPEGYDKPKESWKGFYFPSMSVKLPNVFGGGEGSAQPTVVGNNVVLDGAGLSGAFTGKDLMTGEKANIGGWPFNVSLFGLTFAKGKLTSSDFDGRLRLPVMDKNDWMSFNGSLLPTKDTSGTANGYNLVLGIKSDPLKSELFRANFTFDEGSQVTIPYTNGKFGYPKSNLNGSLAFDIPKTDVGFNPEITGLIDKLKTALSAVGIKDLDARMDLKGLKFTGMKFDWDSNPTFNFGSIKPVGLDLAFLGIKADLKEIAWKQLENDKQGRPKYGFDFDIDFPTLGTLAPKVDFNIGFVMNPAANPKNPDATFMSFGGFGLNFGLPEMTPPKFDVSCGANVPAITFSSEAARSSLDGLEKLRIGFFDVTNLADMTSAGDNTFNGTAKINVPAFGPFGDLSVKLEGIKVNAAGQVIDGKIVTATDADLAGLGAGKLLDAAKAKQPATERAIRNFFKLPVFMGIKGDGNQQRDQGLIITAIDFGPKGAVVDAKVVVTLGGGQYAEFAANDLKLVPNGIAGGQLRLGLGNDFKLPIPGGDNLNIKGYQGGKGSYVACDCGGFVEFQLAGDYPLPTSKFKKLSGDGPVSLGFKINTQEWGEFLGTVEATVPFTVPGIPDFTFAMSEGRIDFSKKRNPAGMAFPEGYESGGGTWRGFFAPTMKITVPSKFTGNNTPTVFTASNILIDSLGLSADLVGKNLVDLSTGSLGSWGFSMDSLALSIRNNGLKQGIFAGGIQMPIMSGKEALPYSATFAPATAPSSYNVKFTARPQKVAVSMLKSTFVFDKGSEITVGFKEGKFQTPKMRLSGLFSVDLGGNGSETSAEISQKLGEMNKKVSGYGIPELDFRFESKGIRFENFVFDMEAEKKFTIKSIKPVETKVSLLGQTADLSTINLAEIPLDSAGIAAGINKGIKMMGFSFTTKLAEETLGLYAPDVTLSLKIKERLINGKTDYSFGGFGLDYKFDGIRKINAACRSEQQTIKLGRKYKGQYTAESFKAGLFTIDQLNITSDDKKGLLSGTGRVTVPVLGPMRHLDVKFDSIVLDANGQLKIGELVTVSDVNTDSTKTTKPDLKSLLGRAKAKLASAAKIFKLPIVMGSESANFTIVGLSLKPQRATVQAKVILPGGDGKFIEFVGEGLTLVPNGIANAEAKLFLGADVDLEPLIGMPLKLKAKAAKGASKASFASCDCDGFRGFQLDGEYTFAKSTFENVKDKTKPVVATMSIASAKWGEFTGKIGGLGEFAIPGVDDITFSVSDGIFDFSKSSNPTGVNIPESYGKVDESWRGFFLPTMSVSLPSYFNNGDTPTVFEASGIVIDTNGVTAKVTGKDVVKLGSSDLGGWGYSLDDIELNFDKNSFKGGRLAGGMQLPMMTKEETMPYTAELGYDKKGMTVAFAARPKEVGISLLRSKFTFDSTSVITVGLKDGKFQTPRVELSGLFSADLGGNGSETSADIDKKLEELTNKFGADKLPNLNFSFESKGIRFENFVFDASKKKKFSIEKIQPVETKISMLGQTANLSAINFAEVKLDSTARAKAISEGFKMLGFSFTTKVAEETLGELYAPTVTLSLKIKETVQKDSSITYGFGGFGLDYEFTGLDAVNASCRGKQADINFAGSYVGAFKEESFKAGLFTIDELNLTDSLGGVLSGTGRVTVPVFGPMRFLDVKFDNIVVDAKGQLKEGSLVTVSDINTSSEAAQGNTNPKSFLENAKKKLKKALSVFKLPIVMGSEEANFTIVGLVFGPKEASVEARVILPGGDGKFIEFVGKGLRIVPTGIAGADVKLALAADADLEPLLGVPLKLKAKAGQEAASFAACDCDGFQGFQLDGEYTFGKNTFKNLDDETKPVVATMSIAAAKWGEFTGKIGGLGKFGIPGVDGITFSVSDGIFDFSKSSNPAGVNIPESYGKVDSTWQGFFLPTMSVSLPSYFNNGDTPTVFEASGIVIDTNGVTAKVTGKDVVKLGSSDLGGWGYSLDDIELNFDKNSFKGGSLAGGMQLPMMTKEETMPYTAELGYDKKGMTVAFAARPKEVGISLLRSKFTFDSTSVITVGLKDGKFQTPRVELSGLFSADLGGNGSETSADIDRKLEELTNKFGADKLPNLKFSFESKGIRFENFVFDASKKKKFSIEKIQPVETKISMLGQTANLSAINFAEVKLDSTARAKAISEGFKMLGFSFTTKVAEETLGELYAPTVTLSLKIKETVQKDSSITYGFGGFGLDYEFTGLDAVNASCRGKQADINFAGSYVGAFKEKSFKAGLFTIDELNLRDSLGGVLSGTGRVTVPVFGPMRFLDVKFDNIVVDAKGQLKEGSLVTVSDINTSSEAAQGNTNPKSFLENAKKKLKKALSVFKLPIVMGSEEANFTIVGLVFGPKEASVEARVILPGGDGKFIEFVGKGLRIVPTGIAGADVKLALAADADLEPLLGVPLKLKAKAGQEAASFAACDCDGFQGFQLDGEYTFGKNTFKNLDDETKPVVATMSIAAAKWGEFTGKIGGLGKFGIPGVDGITFSVSDGIFDFSKSSNPTGVNIPESYGKVDESWQGFFLPTMSVSLPSYFNNGDTPTVFEASGIVIDTNGVTAKVTGKDVVKLGSSDLGGWGYSLDDIELNFDKNSFKGGRLAGGMQLPMMTKEETMPYTAELGYDKKGMTVAFAARPKEVGISLLRSKFTFDSTSVITVGLKDGKFQTPRVELSGLFSADLGGNGSETSADIDKKLEELTNKFGADKLPNLNFSFESKGIRFENFVFDASKKKKFSIEKIQPVETKISMLGQTANLSAINFAEVKLDSTARAKAISEGFKMLGFSFTTKVAEETLGELYAPTVTLSLKIKETVQKDSSITYGFGGFGLDYEFTGLDAVNASCRGKQADINFAGSYVGAFKEESFKAGLFTIDELNLTDSLGGVLSGTGRVTVPVFGPMRFLDVKFDNIVVDAKGQLKEGSLVTVSDINTSSEAAQGNTNPKSFLENAKKKLKKALSVFKLPIVMGSEEANFTIVGLVFGPKEASVEARVILPGGDGKFIEFVGKGLRIVPTGIAGADVKLALAADADLEPLLGVPLKLKAKAGQEAASFAACDCDGFQGFQLDGEYTFGKNTFKNLDDETKPVVATMSIAAAKWGEFTGKIGGLGKFGIPGVDGITFSVSDGIFDFSKSSNPAGVNIPESYGKVDSTWQGFFLPTMSVSLPSYFNNGDTPTVFEASGIVIDTNGVTAKVTGKDVVKLGSSDLGGWGYSLDDIELNFDKNSFKGGRLAGGMQLPMMTKEETMPYTAELGYDKKGMTVAFAARPKEVGISLLRSKFTFDSTSVITVGLKDGKFQTPRVELSGLFSADLGGNGSETSADIDKKLEELTNKFGADKLPNLNFSFESKGIRFENFVFDASKKKKFSIEKIQPVETKISMLGQTANLSAINFAEVKLDSTARAKAISEGFKMLGFSFTTKVAEETLGELYAPTVTLSLKIKETVQKDSSITYGFGGFGLDYEFTGLDAVNASCRGKQADINFAGSYVGAFKEKSFKAGLFTIDELNLRDSLGGVLSGTGRVTVPVFGPMRFLDVKFDNIVVDAKGQLKEGSLVTVSDINTSSEAAQGNTNPKSFLENAKKKLKKALSVFKLPIVMGSEEANFTIVGLVFGPKEASVEARVILPGGDGKFIEFVGRGLRIVPTGIAGADVKLALAADADLEPLLGVPLKLKAKAGQEAASFAACDCDGFQGFQLDGEYTFGKNTFKNLDDETKPVVATMSIAAAKWGEFTGKIGGLGKFGIPGVDGITFSVSDGIFDFSKSSNPAGVNIPESYGKVDSTWQGFFLPTMSVSLPSYFNNGDTPTVFEASGIVIDTNGVTAKVTGKDVVKLGSSDLGGWGYSLDDIELNFDKNSFKGGSLAGGMQLPMMTKEETMPYTAELGYNKKGMTVAFAARPKEVGISLLRSKFTFDSTSVITVGLKDGKFQTPRVELSGLFSADLGGNGSETSADIDKKLEELTNKFGADKLPNLNFSFESKGIRFENFVFDASKKKKFSIEKIQPVETKISMLGQTANLSAINFAEVKLDSTARAKAISEGFKMLGFSFTTKVAEETLGELYAPTVTLSLKIKETVQKDSSITYGFGGFGLDYKFDGLAKVNASCQSDQKEIKLASTFSGEYSKETFKAGLFTIDKLNLTSKQGDKLTGTGRVTVPVLGPMRHLDVQFTDIVLDVNGQLKEGELVTVSDINSDGKESKPDLKTLLGRAKAKLASTAKIFKLPIVMGSEDANFTIVGLKLTPQKASVEAKVILPGGDGKYIEFVGNGLTIVPNGIAGSEVKLSLGADVDLEPLLGVPLRLKAKVGKDTTAASFASCDCDGFQGFQLDGEYTFGKGTFENLEDKTKPVIATMSIASRKWGDFTGKIGGLGKFGIPGVDGITFSVSDGIFDFSKSSNPVQLTTPEGYGEVTDEWMGFFLPEMSVSLPSYFNQGDQPTTFAATGVLIDTLGISAKISGKNVIKVGSADLGGWKYSLDDIELNFSKNRFKGGGLAGGMQLPLMSEKEALPYTADLGYDSTGMTVFFEAKPQEVSISMLKSKFLFDKSSKITVGLKNGKFQTPKVNLSGLFSVDFGGDGSETSSEITKLMNEISSTLSSFNIPDLDFKFNSKGIRFENFVFDMDAESKFSIGDIKPVETNISIFGQKADLSGINLTEIDPKKEMAMLKGKLDEQVKNLSFGFETKVLSEFLGGLAPTVKLDLVIEENTKGVAGLLSYAFKGFNMSWTPPDVNMSCTSNLTPLNISEVAYSGVFEGKEIKVGRFKMDQLNLTENSNGTLAGTGRIEVPVLGPMRYLDVAFERVSLNEKGEIYAGEVITKTGMSNPATTSNMGSLMNNALNKLSKAANDLVKLPVVLGDPESAAFTIVGLAFGPKKAALQTRLIVNTGDDKYLEFTAEGLEIVPNGIADVNVKLGLARSFVLPGLDKVLPVTLKPFDRDNDAGTFASCDCSGFKMFNLAGDVEFSKNYVLSKQLDEAGKPKAVKASFTANSKGWGKFLGKVSVNDSIYMPGSEELPFYLTEALIDLSDDEDHEGMKWPEGYNAPKGGKWNGVYISTASMPVPTVLASNSTGTPGTLRVNDMIMDSTGFTGVFSGEKLLDMETTSLYGFGLALDSFRVAFKANKMEVGDLNGRFNLPLLEAGAGIPFVSKMSSATGDQKYMNFSWEAKPGKVKVPMLSAVFNFDDRSSIAIDRTAKGFTYPKFDMSGSMSVAGDGKGLGNDFDQFVQAINEAAGGEIAPDFNLDSINFEHFVFDPNSSDKYFSIGDIKPNNVNVKFLGQEVKLNTIRFDELKALGMKPDSITATKKDIARQLGFRLDMSVDLPIVGKMPLGVTFKVNEKEEKVKGVRKVDYDFGGLAFDYKFPSLAIPKFSCENPDPPKPPTDQTSVALTSGKNVKLNGFELQVESLSGSSGKGTVRIPFLNYNMKVTFRDLKVNAAGELLDGEIRTDTEGSLIPDMDPESVKVPFVNVTPALTSFLAKTQEFFTLPISLRSKLKETAGLELPEGLDIILLGVIWTEKGGKMDMAITVPNFVEGDPPLQFGVRGLNLRPDGIDLGELKVFLAKTVSFK